MILLLGWSEKKYLDILKKCQNEIAQEFSFECHFDVNFNEILNNSKIKYSRKSSIRQFWILSWWAFLKKVWSGRQFYHFQFWGRLFWHTRYYFYLFLGHDSGKCSHVNFDQKVKWGGVYGENDVKKFAFLYHKKYSHVRWEYCDWSSTLNDLSYKIRKSLICLGKATFLKTNKQGNNSPQSVEFKEFKSMKPNENHFEMLKTLFRSFITAKNIEKI